MQQEATTPEATAETTSTETSTETVETSPESQGTAEKGAGDSTVVDDEAAFAAPNVNFDNIPEEHRRIIEDKQKEIDRHFKRELTRMRQEDRVQSRQSEFKLEELSRQNQEYARIAAEILQDPNKLQEYRQQLAPHLGIEVEAPQINNVQDLLSYAERKAEKMVEQKIASLEHTQMQKETQQRLQSQYNDAVSKLKTEDPRYNQFEKHIAAIVKQPEYQRLYDGKNEYEILKTAYNDLINNFKPQLEKVRNDTLDSLKRKKAATTFTPQKTVATEGRSTGRSKEDIIAAVQARLGPPGKGTGTISSR